MHWFDSSTDSHAFIQSQLLSESVDSGSKYWPDYCGWLTWMMVVCALHDGDSFASSIRSARVSANGLHLEWGRGIRHRVAFGAWDRATRKGLQSMAMRLWQHADVCVNRRDLFMTMNGYLATCRQHMTDTQTRIQHVISYATTGMGIDAMDAHIQCLILSALPIHDLGRFYTGFSDCLSDDMVVVVDGTPIQLTAYFSQVPNQASALIDRVKLHANILVCSTLPTDQRDALVAYTQKALVRALASESSRRELVVSLESSLTTGIIPRQRLLTVAVESVEWPSHR